MKNKTYFKINLIYFTAILLVASLFVLSYFGFIKSDILSSFLIQIVVMAAIPLLMYNFLIAKNFKTTLKDVGFKKISLKTIGIVILLGFILYFLNTFIASFFSSVLTMFGYEKLTQQTTTNFSHGIILKEFILTAILPGICEEILHRGIMLNCTKKVHNTRICLIISSLLFGLTHLNIQQFFYAAILGFLMGYVNLICDSIYPSIIIHFMNNFLSTYFAYGTKLKWPFATFVYSIESIIYSNIISFVIFTVVGVLTLITLYKFLTKCLIKEKAHTDIKNIIKHLRLNQLGLIEAQIKINHVNSILKHNLILKQNEKEKTKPNFVDNVFLYSAIILGVIITIFSFVWGVI